jgi:hypothetical protein
VRAREAEGTERERNDMFTLAIWSENPEMEQITILPLTGYGFLGIFWVVN